jgi:hypothetical protein
VEVLSIKLYCTLCIALCFTHVMHSRLNWSVWLRWFSATTCAMIGLAVCESCCSHFIKCTFWVNYRWELKCYFIICWLGVTMSERLRRSCPALLLTLVGCIIYYKNCVMLAMYLDSVFSWPCCVTLVNKIPLLSLCKYAYEPSRSTESEEFLTSCETDTENQQKQKIICN